MADKMFLELVSPEKLLVSSEVDCISATGVGGAFEILDNHSPFCTELVTCVLTYTIGQETFKVAISGGFLEVVDNKVNVLATRAITASNIDKGALEIELEKAKNELENTTDEGKSKVVEEVIDFLNTALDL